MTGFRQQDPGTTSTRWIDRIRFWHIIVILVLVILIIIMLMGYFRVRAAQDEYRAAVDQVESIQNLVNSDDVYSLSTDDMIWLETEFTTLQERIHRLQDMADLPLGMSGLMESLPWVSSRYAAANETLDLGMMLADSGIIVSNIGTEAMQALETSGIRHEPGDDRTTWLQVIHQRETELRDAVEQIESAGDARAEIKDQYLPASVQRRLDQIDALLDRFSEQLALIDDLPYAYEVMGIDEPRRYLGLFQNPAELRQPGGFSGTIVLLEVHRGQMTSYSFHDIYELSQDYNENRDSVIEPPWAVREYIRPDALQIQDSNWWADFPTSAQVVTGMYHEAGWPEIDGVFAVQPELVSDLMTVTGSVTVDVDGEMREITPENLHDEAERQRRLAREGDYRETDHKEVIALIGEMLVERISDGDRNDLVDGVFILFDALDRRDMQAYFQHDGAQSFVGERDWAGRLVPDPDAPTISTTFANITGLKTSLAMQPEMELVINESQTTGQVNVTLNISMTNTGDDAGDPFYEGFQRWWVEMHLPEGSTVVETSPERAPDTDTLNGGGYIVEVDPGETSSIQIRYTMPIGDELLIRRQPGLVTMQGTVRYDACDPATEFELDQDVLLDLRGGCPEVVVDDADDQ